ncbi:WecB/TagA/CpsF family glycosyltransferase [Larsenimonas salina]|uniref:WecB/TagA/CpsF family glycosyltransferase n=1 Tax=Larsenimonas salina TaxID=1295565 RepID=UPI002074A622|nr:WecB/TagA/CpsF family glycosyltransferase [Larsenimonas salina]MCM5703272.1 WecB/TagA/CpsF family glycosyltransferase [Larsenimonas salina]
MGSHAYSVELENEQAPPRPTVTVLGLPFVNISREEALEALFDYMRAPHTNATVHFINAHCANVAQNHPRYYQALLNTNMVLPDGSGVAIACKRVGESLVANLNGTDLFPLICEQMAEEGLRLFLLGAAPGVADTMADKLKQRFPKLEIVGVQHGFFGTTGVDQVIDKINEARPDLLCVAMGVPHQELWVERYRHRLKVKLAMGVGGLFDFSAEKVSRAPKWLRSIGMEWSWRLMQEPKRMWKRYVVGNPVFLLNITRHGQRPCRRLRSYLEGDYPTFYKWRSFARRCWWLFRRWYGPKARRLLDIGLSLSILGFGGPFLVLVMLWIKLDSKGPIFFSQTRVGQSGSLFKMWKFRSMYIDAEERLRELTERNESSGNVLFKMKKDPRITTPGRIIRKLSIDEIPQLWNVLKGDMALVGPRPALPREVSLYEARARMRLDARPGLTGLWQVSGRSDLSFDEQINLDLFYLHRQGIREDIKLLLRTIPAVIKGRGAY